MNNARLTDFIIQIISKRSLLGRTYCAMHYDDGVEIGKDRTDAMNKRNIKAIYYIR